METEPQVEVELEVYEEVETVGKGLLDRLTVPVIFPDGYDWTHTHAHTHPCTPSNTVTQTKLMRCWSRSVVPFVL